MPAQFFHRLRPLLMLPVMLSLLFTAASPAVALQPTPESAGQAAAAQPAAVPPAQPPPPAEEGFVGSPLYERFLADQQPPENLAPMAFTPCTNGMAGTYPCNRVDLYSFLPLANMGGGNGNVVWGWKDPVTNKEYALFGRSSGTSFIDISNPISPTYIGNLPTHTGVSSSWRDVRVYQNHAYIVSDSNSGHGVQVFDLTQLRNVATPPVQFAETNWYNGVAGNLVSSGHTIWINEDTGYGYVVGSGSCSGGLHMINLQTPVSPTFAGCYSSAGYTHETQCVVYQGPDVAYQGHEICFNSNGRSGAGVDALVIVDVTTKTAPVLLYTLTYTGSGYTHQTWLTDDFRYMLLDDELDEQQLGHNTRTRIFNVADLNAPTLIGTYDGPTTAIDHNIYIKDGLVFEANYRAGLRVLDGAAIPQGGLTEIGYFDIYPSSNSAAFNGAWMAYPYFDNGIIAIAGIEQGLFLVKVVTTPDFSLTAAPNTLNSCGVTTLTNSLVINSTGGEPGPVTFSAQNVPTGVSVSFNPNPLAGNGTTTMTTNVTGSAVPGTYGLSVQAATANYTHTAPVTLTIYAGAPTTPTLTVPANGATNQSLAPTFVWAASSQATSYRLEVATDSGFANVVYSTTLNGTFHALTQVLAENSQYYWRVQPSNLCGAGNHSATYSFTTRDLPPVLLVDDDTSGVDVRNAYTTTLTQLGVGYDVWNVSNALLAPSLEGEPSLMAMQPYSAVIWFSGAAPYGIAGPSSTTEADLVTYLNNYRGCLLLSSQDYSEGAVSSFMSTYLGIATINASANYNAVTGINSVFGGLGLDNVNLSFPFANGSNRVSPNANGQAAFSYSSGFAGVTAGNGSYRTSYWGFPAEALPNSARATAMGAFLNWCGVNTTAAPAYWIYASHITK